MAAGPANMQTMGPESIEAGLPYRRVLEVAIAGPARARRLPPDPPSARDWVVDGRGPANMQTMGPASISAGLSYRRGLGVAFRGPARARRFPPGRPRPATG